MMHEGIEECRNRRRVAEELWPIVERPVRGENRRCTFVAPHNDLEQILGGIGGQFTHPEVVDDEQRNLAERRDRGAALASCAGEQQLFEEHMGLAIQYAK